MSQRTLWITLMLVLLGSTAALCVYARQVAAGPEQPIALLEWTRREFGRVPAGSPLSATCIVRNAGQRRLVVQPHGSSCGCAQAGSETIIVPPGSSAHIDVNVETGGIQGSIEVEFTYFTSDPQLPRFTLAVAADIRSP